MGLKEFFFPEYAEAQNLKKVSRQMARKSRTGRRASKKASEAQKELENMEEDLGFLALVLMSLFNRLVEKDIISRDEVRDQLSEIDSLDGVEDGKLDLDMVRGAMGMARDEDGEDDEDSGRKGPSRRRRNI